MSLTYNNVLVGVDGSKESEWAFKKAIDVCKRNQAQLIITHIIDTRTFATVEAYDRSITERAQSFAEELLQEYKSQAEKAGLPNVVTKIEYGSPKVKIAKDVAPSYNCDLIVCGATGMNAVERFFIGSVSEHITRYAKCDVLVVRTETDIHD
ncbi:universal stress protein [Bacillus sp. HMF5848]|uniref:universal stress protein n=1 Tax=Bacillus sp. HMF5848 TaxID=2495421 RepID=UPI000F795083|nr:universal stress protein [Bacillus sp. HMF5848]RSK28160.1 universal stress protein [Bacillus sp. HMF5848]